MKKRSFEFGKDEKGGMQVRTWAFIEDAQEAKHGMAAPWELLDMKAGSVQIFTAEEIPPEQAASFEPDEQAGPGFFRQIYNQIRGIKQ